MMRDVDRCIRAVENDTRRVGQRRLYEVALIVSRGESRSRVVQNLTRGQGNGGR